jgi:hypothetical protein
VGARERAAPAASIRGDQTEQEDDRLACDQQQPDHREEQRRADRRGPVPRDAQRRQHDEDHEDHDLDPEAAETRAACRFEVVALVLDGPGRRSRASRRGRVGPSIDRYWSGLWRGPGGRLGAGSGGGAG